MTRMKTNKKVLLVEDNVGDVRLIQEAFHGSADIHVVYDGMEAMDFLLRREAHSRAPRPDLIILDLNLPKMHGHDVLARIKGDEDLKTIPTIILSTSDSEEDTLRSYQLKANCHIRKPGEWDSFDALVASINGFWLTAVKLPRS
jgi:CheY-like chemotaxis protein